MISDADAAFNDYKSGTGQKILSSASLTAHKKPYCTSCEALSPSRTLFKMCIRGWSWSICVTLTCI